VRCPRCQQGESAQAKFCEECAAPLARTCPSCGTEASPSAKFCSECAQPLSAAPQPRFGSPDAYTSRHLAERVLTSKTALEGERKQVTVLFADLKGSMELLADRDPEEGAQAARPRARTDDGGGSSLRGHRQPGHVGSRDRSRSRLHSGDSRWRSVDRGPCGRRGRAALPLVERVARWRATLRASHNFGDVPDSAFYGATRLDAASTSDWLVPGA
jgi:hypothetical protein